jgi:hypothetical protein
MPRVAFSEVGSTRLVLCPDGLRGHAQKDFGKFKHTKQTLYQAIKFIGSNSHIRSTILKPSHLKPHTEKEILSFLELNNVTVTTRAIR